MFIEVQAIKLTDAGTETDEETLIKNSDTRLICVHGIRVRNSSKFEDRSEIVMPDGTIIHVVGSYQAVTDRIGQVASVARIG